MKIFPGQGKLPKHMLKIKVRKYLQFYAENFCLSKPMLSDGAIENLILITASEFLW